MEYYVHVNLKNCHFTRYRQTLQQIVFWVKVDSPDLTEHYCLPYDKIGGLHNGFLKVFKSFSPMCGYRQSCYFTKYNCLLSLRIFWIINCHPRSDLIYSLTACRTTAEK